MAGQSAIARRLVVQVEAAPGWWDVDFTPLMGDSRLLGIIGRIHRVPGTLAGVAQPLPEKLLALRQQASSWWGLDKLPVELPTMRLVAEQVRLASQATLPVLLLGETGSGKEWLARTPFTSKVQTASNHLSRSNVVIYQPRHWPGRFMGRLRLHTATVSLCISSTPSVFPVSFKHACARILPRAEHGKGPRLTAGSHSDVAAEVRAGRLMEEFLCMLSPLTIHVPPLRERIVDLPFLVERFLKRANSGRETPVLGLTEDAWEMLRSYSLPGNLAELYDVLATACTRAKGDRLQAANMPGFLRPAARRSRSRRVIGQRTGASGAAAHSMGGLDGEGEQEPGGGVAGDQSAAVVEKDGGVGDWGGVILDCVGMNH